MFRSPSSTPCTQAMLPERFALKAAAGAPATKWGLTGRSPGEAHDAIKRCFGEWLAARGTSANAESGTIIETLRAFISRHEDSRFVEIDAREVAAAPTTPKIVHNRAGWRKRFDGSEREYLIDTEVFRKEIFTRFDLGLVCRVLSASGYLHSLEEHGKRRYGIYRCVGDQSRRPVYVITSALWSDASKSVASNPADDSRGGMDEVGDNA